MSELQCCKCPHNKTIKFVGVDSESFAPICMKAGATRSIMSTKPSWCPIDGTGKPYESEAALAAKDARIKELEELLELAGVKKWEQKK